MTHAQFLVAACLALVLAASLGPAAAAGPTWQQLSAQQRTALAPLEHDWASIDEGRKRKWLEVAERFPRMSTDERERVQGRMTDWARMTPNDRGQARFRYQESRALPSEIRQERWEAYQALPPEERRELRRQAAPAAPGARNGSRGVEKRNVVPNPANAAPPQPIAPTVLKAGRGATTTLISRPPAPPPHQSPGLPKIATTPGFVDRTTLLPQRGPQGAAIAPPPPASGPGRPSR